ncbi:hypothetical protein SGUI_0382 [Serinicoccus hydrothermalis]|uniref:YetF C-terminal domain-containing protein n=1 Tax=Serinicoccus hydrothermalis TaxID=1758689 RepID=A0A1B1N8N5_9MICO|nr:YetF domain-containing protein [Serinicoccus hydrothermalis]ANS77778.1 hypothetical protein SGUI_0382 [Serinicoccus hydrothermalis]
MRDLWHYIGITPAGAIAVVLSTITIYFVFGAVLRLWGQRLYSSPRSLDLAIVTVLGAIVGRSTMGHVPTLTGGLIALGTLAGLEVTFRNLRRLPLPQLDPQSRARAAVLVVAGKVQNDALRSYGLTMPMLWSSLRQAGVSHLSQAALVVLEPNGQISVVRAGQAIHPRALLGVKGAHRVQEHLREAGHLHTGPAGQARAAHPSEPSTDSSPRSVPAPGPEGSSSGGSTSITADGRGAGEGS